MAIASSFQTSPFVECGTTAKADSLAILHLKRDHCIPTVLRSRDELNEGYDEGKVTNTRFGSFPHSTLIGLPWGSQVRASAVDTGSRGRKGWEGKGKKRKRDDGKTRGTKEVIEEPGDVTELKEAKEASTGFVHLLPPTPEVWTQSLPHRTQVVYTPDYSYIIHRIRARPGSVLIEAGAGSGSFTHAAARAVYNGPPEMCAEGVSESTASKLNEERRGMVYSFEFHEQRAQTLKEEIKDHGLADVVSLTYRDVCADGFTPGEGEPVDIKASAIFLDLPAPWLALKHLTRNPAANGSSHQSPLDPSSSIHLCTFSPCIEQVTRTISTLRALGWVEIEMVEIAAKRIEVRRDRVGLQEEGLRGVNDSPADVGEALTRLRDVEGRTRVFHTEAAEPGDQKMPLLLSKQQRLENIRLAQEGRKLYKEGRLTHRPEPELKTHTSYLVFAILPREWSDEDEQSAQRRWSGFAEVGEQKSKPLGKKARKREAMAKAGGNKALEPEEPAEEAVPP